MEKEIDTKSTNPEAMYNHVQLLRQAYGNALLLLPSFTQACAELVFEGKEINSVDFKEKDTLFEVRSYASKVNDVLTIATITPDFETRVMLYSNTSALNGKGDKNGGILFERTCVRPIRKPALETKERTLKGGKAIKTIKGHIEEIEWLGLQDFAAK